MLIYRLENEYGQGIYNGTNLGFICNAQTLARDESVEAMSRHPGPENDAGLARWWEGPRNSWSKAAQAWYDIRSQYICGFADEEQMLRWFPREGFSRMISEINKDAAYYGDRKPRWYHVSVYKIHANKVRKGHYQAMFRREDAQLVERRPLSSYCS